MWHYSSASSVEIFCKNLRKNDVQTIAYGTVRGRTVPLLYILPYAIRPQSKARPYNAFGQSRMPLVIPGQTRGESPAISQWHGVFVSPKTSSGGKMER